MPQSDDPKQPLAEAGPGRCEAEPPSSWADFFSRHGMTPTCPNDRRRFRRVYFRGTASLEYRQSFPACPRSRARYRVCTKDLSRGGLAFLHSEQLFPRERMSIVLPDGKAHDIEVVRCRRIEPRCFEIGAVFTASLREPATPAKDPNQPT